MPGVPFHRSDGGAVSTRRESDERERSHCHGHTAGRIIRHRPRRRPHCAKWAQRPERHRRHNRQEEAHGAREAQSPDGTALHLPVDHRGRRLRDLSADLLLRDQPDPVLGHAVPDVHRVQELHRRVRRPDGAHLGGQHRLLHAAGGADRSDRRAPAGPGDEPQRARGRDLSHAAVPALADPDVRDVVHLHRVREPPVRHREPVPGAVRHAGHEPAGRAALREDRDDRDGPAGCGQRRPHLPRRPAQHPRDAL